MNKLPSPTYEQGRHRFEWVHRRADGTDFPAEVWLTVFKLGERTLIQGLVQDLTERKQVEVCLTIISHTDILSELEIAIHELSLLVPRLKPLF